MDNPTEEGAWEEEMPQVEWDIRREGYAWGDNARQRYELSPEKIEMIGGRLFWTETDRLLMLGLLLENLGVDKAL